MNLADATRVRYLRTKSWLLTDWELKLVQELFWNNWHGLKYTFTDKQRDKVHEVYDKIRFKENL